MRSPPTAASAAVLSSISEVDPILLPFLVAITIRQGQVPLAVVEHMYRWIRWEIASGSMDHKKTDARTIEFRPTIGRGGEDTINYTDPLHLVKPRQALPQSAG